MSKQTLIIIDVQEGYRSDITHNFIDKIRSLILEWRKNQLPIIVVRMAADGRFDQRLCPLIEEYQNAFWCEKNQNDGSVEIQEVIEQNELSRDVVVCGMYEDLCVRDTVYGMLSRYAWEGVRVVKDALIAWSDNIEDIMECDGMELVYASNLFRPTSCADDQGSKEDGVADNQGADRHPEYFSVRAGS